MQVGHRSLPDLQANVGLERVDAAENLGADEEQLGRPVEGARSVEEEGKSRGVSAPPRGWHGSVDLPEHWLIKVELGNHGRRGLVNNVGREGQRSTNVCNETKSIHRHEAREREQSVHSDAMLKAGGGKGESASASQLLSLRLLQHA